MNLVMKMVDMNAVDRQKLMRNQDERKVTRLNNIMIEMDLEVELYNRQYLEQEDNVVLTLLFTPDEELKKLFGVRNMSEAEFFQALEEMTEEERNLVEEVRMV